MSEDKRTWRELDGVRGIAILLVVFHHFGFFVKKGGYLGVELFFVLSGFLINNLLLTEVERTGKLSIKAFWIRRALRLLPALLFVVSVMTVYSLLFATPEQTMPIWRAIPTSLFYIANWVKAYRLWDFYPLHHTWSLAIEEQFYIAWPLLFLFFWRKWKLRGLFWLCIIGVVLSTGTKFLLLALRAGGGRFYNGTDTRAMAVLVGCLLACWIHSGYHWTFFQKIKPYLSEITASSLIFVTVSCALVSIERRTAVILFLPIYEFFSASLI
jgi:peptidoglycan/LPS O-acetylase OafA/YrhL